MGNLPIEILEHILSFCDSETLYSVSLSCELLRELSSRRSVWKIWKSAFNSVPDFYLTDILESLNPKYYYTPDEINWFSVFELWKKWRFTGDWNVNLKKKKCISKVKPWRRDMIITSSAVSGKWLITASWNFLYATDINTKKSIVIFRDTYILTFKLACDLSPDCVDPSQSWLPGVEHDKVIITLDRNADAILDLHTGRVRYMNNIGRWEDFRQHEHHVFKVKRGDVVEVQCTNIFKPEEEVTWTFEQTEEYPYLVDVWRSKALFFNGDQYIVFDASQGNDYSAMRNVCWSGEPKINILETRYCELRIIICREDSVGNTLFIQVGDKTGVNIYPLMDYDINVTCATFRAGFLFLGCAEGRVLAYSFSNIEDIVNLRLNEYFWSYDLNENDGLKSHIININVLFKDDISMWITTKKQVFKIVLANTQFY